VKAYRISAWGADPEWVELPEPAPGPGDVLVEVEACGVGLTVLNCINGDLANDVSLLPRVPGHELVGRVVEVGPEVDESLLGTRVVAYFYLFCDSCDACIAGDQSLCRRLAGWVGVHSDGGYARRAVLPARNAVPIDDSIDPIAATVIPDAVATPVHVAGRADIGPEDRVVVIGAGGGVGVHMIQVAASLGAEIAGFDIDESKLAEIARRGAMSVDSSDLAAVDADALFEDGPPTVVVDFLGTVESARWAIDGLATGGRLVALTTFRDRRFPIESRELVFSELSILGSRYARRDQLAEAARLIASGWVEPVIGRVETPECVGAIHDELRAGTLIGRGAIDWRTT
jgi:propanol-preferring alcohol dehydrogenase